MSAQKRERTSAGSDVERPGAGGREEITAFVDVNVIPMNGTRILTDHTVIVAGDRIREVGPSDRTGVPEGARIIVGVGRFLLPGLADMHAHIPGPDALVLFVANGVTTVRNMWGDDSILALRSGARSHGLIAPTIHTTGPGLDGNPPLWPQSSILESSAGVEAEVRRQALLGYDALKVFTNLRADVYQAILESARTRRMPVYGHVPTRVGLRRALGLGQQSFEHMYDFIYALLPEDSPIQREVIDGYDALDRRAMYREPFRAVSTDGIPALATAAASAHVWFCPTLVLMQKMAFDATELDTLLRESLPAYLDPALRDFWTLKADTLLTDPGDPGAMKRGLAVAMQGVSALHRAGVRLLIGTDTPNPFVVPGLSVHEELENLVASGLSPYEALEAATSGPAEFLGNPGAFGRVTAGARADLVLLEGNPLDDIKATRDRAGVMLEGRWYAVGDLTAMLDELAAGYARPNP